MALVEFTKVAAGPNFGPYNVGDVADLNAGDVTAHSDPTVAAVKTLKPTDPRKPNKKGT